VQSAFLERGQDVRRVALDLADELRNMQVWLQLDRTEVSERGDLAPLLRRTMRQTDKPGKRKKKKERQWIVERFERHPPRMRL
jgi:hypothetical protein